MKDIEASRNYSNEDPDDDRISHVLFMSITIYSIGVNAVLLYILHNNN
jgi:hypothetical protein